MESTERSQNSFKLKELGLGLPREGLPFCRVSSSVASLGSSLAEIVANPRTAIRQILPTR